MKKIFLYTLLGISLVLNAFTFYILTTQNPMNVEGQMSWIDFYSNDSNATTKFLNDTLKIDVAGTNKPENISDEDFSYKILKAKTAIFPLAGVMQITEKYKKEGMKAHSTMYLTVKNYDKSAAKFVEHGAKPILENLKANNMRFGFYIIPGGVEVGIVEYVR